MFDSYKKNYTDTINSFKEQQLISSEYILPNSTIKVAQYTYPLLTLPGVFVVGNQTYRVSDNDKYNAPIVVLVNEGNQSAAETWLGY